MAGVRFISDERVARFVSARLGISVAPPFTTLGIEREGEVIAGLILHFFEGANIFVTVAGTGWTRSFLRAVGTYVFDQLGCERMTAITSDPRVARYGERLGGMIEGRLRSHFGPGHDGIIVGILRDEWRY